jgi:hypothetical protein
MELGRLKSDEKMVLKDHFQGFLGSFQPVAAILGWWNAQ